ncbi:glycoside hydrolase family 17 protein [Melanomma pulvis-pyrius CBS 109.77]|uniref:Glycoside hydrolase family 17 protein n=1 Tax=Melanomma pulvis-pyrius CBS 109.77 TaxID=1314802 RepID=A0A6A6WT58_9PLEO|nr:glycoside hydrolase family 17 protein [Melanomma pulvis-pyrius CBS 109.77]
MRIAFFLAVVASFGVTLADEIYLGFNSGSTTDSKTAKKQADFEREFEAAQKLKNSPGLFNSIRLYTNIQAETEDTPIEAFPAAIKTNTKLLLGIWCSGTTSIEKELKALTKAVDQYGKNFTDLVVGISVGSEDMYRVSASGVKNKAGLGQNAKTIIGFIKDVRESIKDTTLRRTPVGHVDTWTAWVNESNKDVIDEVDFLGTNLFPYYEDDKGNAISNATSVFEFALNSTEKVAGNKQVWVTETGWPTSGPDFGQAKATLDNAKTYWNDIGCTLFGRKNVWWYVLRDSNPDNKAKFAITNDLSTTPQFNLTCPANSGAPSSINNNTTSAGSSSSVSMMSTIIVALSMTFALAAWVA